ncbi:hypothetical protein ZPAH1_orf00006 [Aeromonas phage ZPAH1]|nr:hypothetical protein ASwh1_370 [Aeromonas phage Aswh_1]QQG33768.1 hypothetical protein ZPAH1_orf00006 [Aeromonas phage ZPAH1]
MNTKLRNRLNNMLGNQTLVCTSTEGTITMKGELTSGGMDFVVNVSIKKEDGSVVEMGCMSTRKALESFGDSITHIVVKNF